MSVLDALLGEPVAEVASTSRERWKRWEAMHGKLAPAQVHSEGGQFHVRVNGGGKSMPMTGKAAHARATEINREHVAGLKPPAGVVVGHTRNAQGQHVLTVGRGHKRARPSSLSHDLLRHDDGEPSIGMLFG